MKPSCIPLCGVLLLIAACRPGPIDDGVAADEEPPTDVHGGVVGDRWHCGELGLTCVGPLGIGECIDDQCTGRLGPDCLGVAVAPTCDAYCQRYELSCAFQGCEGATVWGWFGTIDWANHMCLDGDKPSAMPLAVACDAPLEGLLDVIDCCCL